MKTKSPTHRPARSGFTLVELLVAITVVAILVGMLTAAVIPAFRRAREAAAQMEMKQIELAIENFKNQYGFYPPNFEVFHANTQDLNGDGAVNFKDEAVLLNRYVNRMSPNHAEGQGHPVHTDETRLEHWYEQVGLYMARESSLVFWLSGICKNKQYPVTGGSNLDGPPLAAHNYGNDGIERDVFFEFKASQLFGDEVDEIVKYTYPIPPVEQLAIPTALRPSATFPQGVILAYSQGSGPQDADFNTDATTSLLYKYADAPSYGFVNAYSTDGVSNYLNPKSFQLITFGLDGASGSSTNAFNAGVKADDNLVNFADGRLDKFVNANR